MLYFEWDRSSVGCMVTASGNNLILNQTVSLYYTKPLLLHGIYLSISRGEQCFVKTWLSDCNSSKQLKSEMQFVGYRLFH